ncbi:MAG: hypothetical protein M3Q55_09100, partial [Acidobacteriota bacterium]|nr:hypothetical protein [Acidobacteriota bacterium]
MNRIFTVAQMEFLTLVRTKAFIIGILMMPVLIAISVGFQLYAARHVDVEDRKLAVIDHSGALYDTLAAAAVEHNQKSGEGDARTGPRFLLERIDTGGRPADAIKLELSDRVRSEDLFAFVEIPPDVVDAPADKTAVGYYTGTPSYEALRDWMYPVINRELARQRFTRSGIDPALVTKLSGQIELSRFDLFERAADGTVTAARETDPIATFVMPFVFLFLMFMSVMTGAQHLLNAIVEEKMSKISEVLV